MRPRLTAETISFRYRAQGEAPWVFEGVSLDVYAGEILVLLGPNGTGKSTLLKNLAGLLTPQQGQVSLDGAAVRSLGPARLARRIGYVAQSAMSTFPFTVRDIVVMGRAPHLNALASPAPEDLEIAAAMMADAGITHLADRSCHEISAGEWQMTLLARALAQQPDILLLDEPTSHLDIGNQVRVLGTLRRLAARGIGVVLASHVPDHAFMAGGRVAILKDHHLLTCGRADEVITSETLRRVYDVDVRVAPHAVGRMVCAPVLDHVDPHAPAETAGPNRWQE